MSVEDGIEAQAADVAAEEAGFAEQFNDSPTHEVADEQAETSDQDLQTDAPAADEAEQSTTTVAEPNAEQDEHSRLLALLNEIPERSALTEKEIRQLHGKFGEVNKALQELKSSNSGTANVRVTADQFKRLGQEFPEIAEMLAEDLAGMSLNASGGNFNPEFMQSEVAKVRDEMNQTMQKNLLTIQHRDWAKVVGSGEFGKWKQSLPAEDQQQLDNSWDAMYLGEKITDFKSWRDKTNNTQQQRNTRLANAILPKTSNNVSRGLMTEEDAFAAQFK